MTVLGQHIDRPEQRHRLVLLDDRRLRCHDCAFTLVLPTGAGSTSTSQSPIPGKGEPRCATHPTEHAATCRTCAADAKAATDLDVGGRHTPELEPTADVAARAAEARAVLVDTIGPRSPAAIARRVPPLDAERMAQARAELDARPPVPVPDEEPADA